MKKLIFVLLLGLSFLVQCIVPHVNRNLYEVNKDTILLDAKVEKVTSVTTGSILVLGLLPTGDNPDTKLALTELFTKNNCKKLENIEVEYYQRHFFLLGFPKLVIYADCIK